MTRVPAVGVHVGQQLVAGDAGVVHDDVEPAVAGAGVVEDPLAGVGAVTSSLQRRAADLVGDRAPGASPAAGTSTPTTVAPSRARTRAIAAPMPRAAPVTTATLPASGRSPESRRAAGAGADPEHLAVDVGRAAGQEELDGAAAPSASAPSATSTRLAVAPARSSLADRADEALERPPGGALRGRAGQSPGRGR